MNEYNEHEEDELTRLRHLKATAPPDTISRLRRRLRILQASKDLVERQARAFWIVLDTFLKLFFTRRSGRKLPPS